MLPTGNQWIALPDIRANDGALTSWAAAGVRRTWRTCPEALLHG
jgi:hypothetical protein